MTGSGPEAPAPHAPGFGPPAPRPTSGFAIASFVLGLLGGVVLSVIFGLVALSRIKRQGLEGKGFTVAGLILSGLWTVVFVGVFALSALSDADRDSSGRITDAGSVSTLDLRKGDCLNDFDTDGEALSVDAVPCAQPHTGEVLSDQRLPFSADSWPGQAAVDREASRRCQEEVDALTEDVGAPSAFFFRPTQETWEQQDDRSVTCVARFQGRRRGSL